MDDLISRAALLDEFHSLCGPQTGDGWDNMGVRNLIVRQKAVDAIPVDWLRDKMRGYASSLKSTETAALVMVMQMWQKEQEKQGIEPKEG